MGKPVVLRNEYVGDCGKISGSSYLWDYGLVTVHFRKVGYSSHEPGADYAFVDEFLSSFQSPIRVYNRHPSASSRTAGRSIEKIVFCNHDVLCMPRFEILDD